MFVHTAHHEQDRSDEAVVEHLEDGAGHSYYLQRADAQENESHVADT